MTGLPVADHLYHPQILDTRAPEGRDAFEALCSAAGIQVVDSLAAQRESLARLVPAPDHDLLSESSRWIYYPWRRSVVHLLGPRAFRRLRLDRNHNMITAAEQDRLGRLRIGVVGLSVGHVIAHTLAAEGLAGSLVLADFDELEVSNLNRVPATVLDLGENKAVIAARRIAELDPYLEVRVLTGGLTADSTAEFLSGLDVVIEECDALDIKALVRLSARAAGIPVVMATSDRGMVDVERFDLEPDRPILHGLIGDSGIEALAGLTARDKIPHVLRLVDAAHGSARGAASMLEVGRTISTWPQLASDVIVGAAAAAEAVRRIGLGEELPSGRARIDVGDVLGGLTGPGPTGPAATEPEVAGDPARHGTPAQTVAEAAARAPSGGNAQPWRIDFDDHALTLSLDPTRSVTMDVEYRGSAVAVGAAMFNARVAAAAAGILGPVEWFAATPDTPLRGVLHFSDDDALQDPTLAALYGPMHARETNRRIGTPEPLDDDTIQALTVAARSEGADLTLLTAPADLDRAARILDACDRIRFLTPAVHREMRDEMRWPGDPDQDTGIDVRSLELDPADLAALDILRRPDVMDLLASWDTGAALGESTRNRVLASSALGVITTTGATLRDHARGGSALEAVWIAANRLGLAVHPCSPLFVHAQSGNDRRALSPEFADTVDTLAHEFNDLVATHPGHSMIIVLRFSRAAPPTVRSRRRPVRDRDAR